MSNRMSVLEVIACSVADAVEAEQGGARRLELISDFARGGLTPSVELVREITAVVSIPVRVMLRESDGYGVSGNDEKDRLYEAARQFAQLPIDGFVLGFLRSGHIDVELTKQICAIAPSMKATFHHAFEETDPFAAIVEIKKIKQVDRILTHGGAGSWPDRIEQLAIYQRQSQPEIEIIAGGGLDAEKIATISSATTIREFHVGRAARSDGTVDGLVRAALVKMIVDATRPRAVSAE